MPLGLQSVVPKTYKVINTDRLEADLIAANTQFLTAVQRRMQFYPAQGSDVDYVRTGDYGKGWSAPGSLRATADTATLINRNGHSVYVGGPRPGNGPGQRQAASNRKRGWPSISDVARAEVKAYPQLINKAIRGRP